MVKIAGVGLSGGVDSAVSVLLLKKAGYEVIGLTMALADANAPDNPAVCYSGFENKKLDAVRKTAERLKIKHFTIDVSAEFRKNVLDYSASEYMAGRTPNPCAHCNKFVKFGAFFEKAEKTCGIDFFATGHYARIVAGGNGNFCLQKAKDEIKDQSYFLWRLDRKIFPCLLFPLGGMNKTEVRRIARENGFDDLAKKTESQDFLKPADIFRNYKPAPGNIYDIGGKKIGIHNGITNCTIGQRKGMPSGMKEPYYALKICPETNSIIAGTKESLNCKKFRCSDINILHPKAEKNFSAFVKIRSQHIPAQAEVKIDESGFAVEFTESQLSVTPGQSAVFYDEFGIVLAGGQIETADNPALP